MLSTMVLAKFKDYLRRRRTGTQGGRVNHRSTDEVMVVVQQFRAEIDALGRRSSFCENFRTVAHSGLLNNATSAISLAYVGDWNT